MHHWEKRSTQMPNFVHMHQHKSTYNDCQQINVSIFGGCDLLDANNLHSICSQMMPMWMCSGHCCITMQFTFILKVLFAFNRKEWQQKSGLVLGHSNDNAAWACIAFLQLSFANFVECSGWALQTYWCFKDMTESMLICFTERYTR